MEASCGTNQLTTQYCGKLQFILLVVNGQQLTPASSSSPNNVMTSPSIAPFYDNVSIDLIGDFDFIFQISYWNNKFVPDPFLIFRFQTVYKMPALICTR